MQPHGNIPARIDYKQFTYLQYPTEIFKAYIYNINTTPRLN